MRKKFIQYLEKKVMSEREIIYEEAKELLDIDGSAVFNLFTAANSIKEHFVGKKVHLCGIINAKSGRCPENCGFCAQSIHHETDVEIYGLVGSDDIVNAAKDAEKNGTTCFGIVTSGSGIKDDEEFDAILESVRKIRSETSVSASASLGMVTYEQALSLKDAGLVTYHHNIETSRNFFKNVCTTHDYDDDINTIKNVKRAGLKTCSGVIFGLGETGEDWLDMAFTLKELDVDSIPINFLNPIKNTRFENNMPIPPLELLKGVALFRFILPKKRISVCGGRERNLRDLQSFMFLAGANGTMTGDYLTTKGRNRDEDITMIHDLGLEVG